MYSTGSTVLSLRVWSFSSRSLINLRAGSTGTVVQFFSSPSDLMKSTVVDESLSTTTTRVLFQRETTYILHDNDDVDTTIGGLPNKYSRIHRNISSKTVFRTMNILFK